MLHVCMQDLACTYAKPCICGCKTLHVRMQNDSRPRAVALSAMKPERWGRLSENLLGQQETN